MFSKTIVLSDAFLEMPCSSRCLYFTLNMVADDDGFVNSPKSIMRQAGCTEDDLKILFAKKFVIPFESGIVVIKHWRINNYLRNDRYRETNYIDEKSELIVEPNGSYALAEKVIPEQTAKKTVPLIEREPKNDLERVEKEYLLNYQDLYKSGILRMDKPVINWIACRKLTNEAIKKYGIDVVIEAVRKSKDNQFCIEKGYSLTTILSAGVFAGLVNGSQSKKKGVVNEQFRTEEIVF